MKKFIINFYIKNCIENCIENGIVIPYTRKMVHVTECESGP